MVPQLTTLREFGDKLAANIKEEYQIKLPQNTDDRITIATKLIKLWEELTAWIRHTYLHTSFEDGG